MNGIPEPFSGYGKSTRFQSRNVCGSWCVCVAKAVWAECWWRNSGSCGLDSDEKGGQIGAVTHMRRVVQSGGRVRVKDWERRAGMLMESESVERVEFPAGREYRFGRAGNAWVVVRQGRRRSLREQAQWWKRCPPTPTSATAGRGRADGGRPD